MEIVWTSRSSFNTAKIYKLEAWRAGYLEGSAIPMQPGMIHMLVDYLDSPLSTAPPGTMQLLVERDIVLILLMWETPMRGNNGGKLTWSDSSWLRASKHCTPCLDPFWLSTSVMIRPNGTKTVKGQRSGPFTLAATADTQHSCLPRLLTYLQLRYPDGKITHQLLFSPLASHQRTFEDKCLTASALGQRLTKHLQDAELYAGESNHGFRPDSKRGSLLSARPHRSRPSVL